MVKILRSKLMSLLAINVLVFVSLVAEIPAPQVQEPVPVQLAQVEPVQEEMMQALMNMFQDPNYEKLAKEQLAAGIDATSDEAMRAGEHNKRDERISFYQTYLSKYFPKVFVIRSEFMRMKPEQIIEALADIIDLFALQPWFYFKNNPNGFRLLHYWEYVVDQLSYINDFIANSRITIKDGTIIPPADVERMLMGWTMSDTFFQDTEDLSDYLIALNPVVIINFYALCFDYLIKLFNEGILLKQLGATLYYYSELEYVMKRLHGSWFEAEYQESMKTARELRAILKEKMGVGDNLLTDLMSGSLLGGR